jgi:transcriptional regulator with XRE-family HTH domain
MTRDNILARVFLALSEMAQEEFAEELGVVPSLIAQFEAGEAVPGRLYLHGMASVAGLTLADGEALLCLYERLRAEAARRQGGETGRTEAGGESAGGAKDGKLRKGN